MREPLRQDIGLLTSAVLPCSTDKHVLRYENNFSLLEKYVSRFVRSIADPENKFSSPETDPQSPTDDASISCSSRIVPRILVQPPSSPTLSPVSETEVSRFPGVLEELGESEIRVSEGIERDELLSARPHAINQIEQENHGRARYGPASSASFPSTVMDETRTLGPTFATAQPPTLLISPEVQEAEICQAAVLDKSGVAWKPSFFDVDEASPIQTMGGVKDPVPYGVRPGKSFTASAGSFNLDSKKLNDHVLSRAISYRPTASPGRNVEENSSMTGEAELGSSKTLYQEQEENLGEMAWSKGASGRSTQQNGRESDLSTKPPIQQPEKQRRHVLFGLIAPRESSAVRVEDESLSLETELHNEAYQPQEGSSTLVPVEQKEPNRPSQSSSHQAIAPPTREINRRSGDGHLVPSSILAQENGKDRNTIIIDTSPPLSQHRNSRTGDQSSSLNHVKRVIASLLNVYDVQGEPGLESVRKFIVKGRWVESEETTESASIFQVEHVSTKMVDIEKAKVLEDAEDVHAPDGSAAMNKHQRSEMEGTNLISLALAQMTNLQVFE